MDARTQRAIGATLSTFGRMLPTMVQQHEAEQAKQQNEIANLAAEYAMTGDEEALKQIYDLAGIEYEGAPSAPQEPGATTPQENGALSRQAASQSALPPTTTQVPSTQSVPQGQPTTTTVPTPQEPTMAGETVPLQNVPTSSRLGLNNLVGVTQTPFTMPEDYYKRYSALEKALLEKAEHPSFWDRITGKPERLKEYTRTLMTSAGKQRLANLKAAQGFKSEISKSALNAYNNAYARGYADFIIKNNKEYFDYLSRMNELEAKKRAKELQADFNQKIKLYKAKAKSGILTPADMATITNTTLLISSLGGVDVAKNLLRSLGLSPFTLPYENKDGKIIELVLPFNKDVIEDELGIFGGQ